MEDGEKSKTKEAQRVEGTSVACTRSTRLRTLRRRRVRRGVKGTRGSQKGVRKMQRKREGKKIVFARRTRRMRSKRERPTDLEGNVVVGWRTLRGYRGWDERERERNSRK